MNEFMNLQTNLISLDEYNLGYYSFRLFTYLPTKFSSTELLPADWPPTTAICGKSNCICTPSWVKASCNLFTIGINCSIPIFPAMAAGFLRHSSFYELLRRTSPTDFSFINMVQGNVLRKRKRRERPLYLSRSEKSLKVFACYLQSHLIYLYRYLLKGFQRFQNK